MKRRKMNKKMNNKGFTLVELIVVLVILAILAAILVPTLMGYIERARSEKDYSTAQSVRVAAQSVAAEIYAKNGKVEDSAFDATMKKKALELVGVDSSGKLDGQTVSIDVISFSGNQISTITVGIGDGDQKKQYRYEAVKNLNSAANTWEAVKTSGNTSGGNGSGQQ